MVKASYLFTLLLSLCIIGDLSAQTAEISRERKRAIDSLALEKVRDLSKYISIIGSKNTAFSEATRVMDRAEELFAPDSEMGVSSLNRKEINYIKLLMKTNKLVKI